MFKITAEPKFTHTVIVCVPTDGGHEEQSVKVTFRVLDADKLGSEGGTKGQVEDLRRLIVRLDDLVDEADQPMPYSDALRDQLLYLPYVRTALIQAYTSAVTKAKTGN